MCISRWKCLLVLLISVTQTCCQSVHGSVRCPCIKQHSVANLVVLGSHDAPTDYGIGCGVHDAKNNSRCYSETGTSRADWCDSAWCYVDNNVCAVEHEDSSVLQNNTGWSYSTCGYLNVYTTWMLASALKGDTVEVAQMTNSGGWKGSYCEDASDCTGATFDFLDQVMEQMGIVRNTVATFKSPRYDRESKWPPQEVLRQVYEENPKQQSAFDVCVFATAMGYVDVCIGAFTLQTERVQRTPHIVLYAEPVHLVTPILGGDAESLGDYLAKPFRPFRVDLWILIAVTISGLSVLLAWQERYFGSESAFHELSITKTVGLALYRGWLSFLCSGSLFEPVSGPGRATSLGLSVFILVVITSYTANLASSLVLSGKAIQPLNMEELVDRGHSICLERALVSTATSNYPVLNGNGVLVPLLKRANVLPAVFNGDCQAAIMKLEDADSAARCGNVHIGEALFHVFIGIPVSSRVHREIDYHIKKYMNRGGWSHHTIHARRLKRGSRSRSSTGTSAGATATHQAVECEATQKLSTSAMSPDSMAGALAVSAIVIAFGMICRPVRTLRHNETLKKAVGGAVSQNLPHLVSRNPRSSTETQRLKSYGGDIQPEESSSLTEMAYRESSPRQFDDAELSSMVYSYTLRRLAKDKNALQQLSRVVAEAQQQDLGPTNVGEDFFNSAALSSFPDSSSLHLVPPDVTNDPHPSTVGQIVKGHAPD